MCPFTQKKQENQIRMIKSDLAASSIGVASQEFGAFADGCVVGSKIVQDCE